MLIRICLIVAIVGALAAAAINFLQVKDKIATTIKDRNDNAAGWATEKDAKNKALKERDVAQKSLDSTKKTLTATLSDLETAKSSEAEARKQKDALAAELDKTKKDVVAKDDELAKWLALGVPVEQIRETIASLKTAVEAQKALETEKKVLLSKNHELQAKLHEVLGESDSVVLPSTLKGTVLVVDPKYSFVLLDVGSAQGAEPNGQMLVNRNGKLVAKVRINSVQDNRCIANVLPGWRIDDVMEGDSVIP